MRSSRKSDRLFGEDLEAPQDHSETYVFYATRRFVCGTLLDTENGKNAREKWTGIEDDAVKKNCSIVFIDRNT